MTNPGHETQTRTYDGHELGGRSPKVQVPGPRTQDRGPWPNLTASIFNIDPRIIRCPRSAVDIRYSILNFTPDPGPAVDGHTYTHRARSPKRLPGSSGQLETRVRGRAQGYEDKDDIEPRIPRTRSEPQRSGVRTRSSSPCVRVLHL